MALRNNDQFVIAMHELHGIILNFCVHHLTYGLLLSFNLKLILKYVLLS